MPHVAVKMYAGRTRAQKEALAKALVETVTRTLECSDDYVTVTIEDYDPAAWQEQVYQPEIIGKPDILFKKPGY